LRQLRTVSAVQSGPKSGVKTAGVRAHDDPVGVSGQEGRDFAYRNTEPLRIALHVELTGGIGPVYDRNGVSRQSLS
jgi:hypothetical protein